MERRDSINQMAVQRGSDPNRLAVGQRRGAARCWEVRKGQEDAITQSGSTSPMHSDQSACECERKNKNKNKQRNHRLNGV